MFKDVCAYTCIFPDCPITGVLIEDNVSMMSHIRSQHCTRPGFLDIVCPLCRESVKGPVDIAAVHLARHMEEIALTVLPRGEELEDDSDSSVDTDIESELRGSEPTGIYQAYSPLDRTPSPTSLGLEPLLENDVDTSQIQEDWVRNIVKQDAESSRPILLPKPQIQLASSQQRSDVKTSESRDDIKARSPTARCRYSDKLFRLMLT